MIPVTQTKFGRTQGNCYAACIASIFEVPLELLPAVPEDSEVVVKKYQTDTNKDYWKVENYFDAWWWDMWDAWFKDNNLIRYRLPYKTFDQYKWPKGYAILIGESDRGFKHAVVALDGKIVHDPHPDRTNLVTMEEWEFIIPADPKVMLKGITSTS